jgi:cell division septation protein DedD
MIGVLVLALLGGFGALLIDQRRPVAQAPVTTEPSTTVVIPASPGTVSELPTPQTTAPTTSVQTAPAQTTPAQTATDQASGTQTNPAQTAPTAQSGQGQPAQTQSTQTPTAQTPAQSGAATEQSTQPQTPQTSAAQQGQTTGTGAGTATTAPQTTDDGTAAATEIPPVPTTPPVGPLTTLPLPENAQPVQPPVTAEPAQPQTAATTAAPRAGGAVAASAARTPLRSDYRISLGSFATERTVRSQTAGVSGLGYTVYPIDIGDGYVAQVGPFADEATARQALADIQRASPGALLYRPRERAAQTEADRVSTPATTESPSSTSAAPETSAETAPSQDAATPAAQAPAPSGPRYLQVGAFDREESAQRLVGMLRDAGFAPTVSAPPEGKVTVLVGPYSGDALLRAEGRLDTAGMDHFRVR